MKGLFAQNTEDRGGLEVGVPFFAIVRFLGTQLGGLGDFGVGGREVRGAKTFVGA